jgi:hypothetical protein
MVENPSTFELSPFLWKELWIAPPPSLVFIVLCICPKFGQAETSHSFNSHNLTIGSTCRKGAQVADGNRKVLGESLR